MSKRIPRYVADLVATRADGACEIMHPEAGCTGGAEHLHHRKLRSQGGGHTVSNLVHICAACHRWVHGHPAAAYRCGWLVHGWDDPEETPMLRRSDSVMLSKDGKAEATYAIMHGWLL